MQTRQTRHMTEKGTGGWKKRKRTEKMNKESRAKINETVAWLLARYPVINSKLLRAMLENVYMYGEHHGYAKGMADGSKTSRKGIRDAYKILNARRLL